MKKILVGVLALMLISGSTAFAADKGKRAKKARKECKMTDCKKNKKDCPDPCPAICPMPCK